MPAMAPGPLLLSRYGNTAGNSSGGSTPLEPLGWTKRSSRTSPPAEKLRLVTSGGSRERVTSGGSRERSEGSSVALGLLGGLLVFVTWLPGLLGDLGETAP